MNFFEAIKSGFGKYIIFSGRARRAEFWWFALFVVLGGIVAGYLDFRLFPSMLSGPPTPGISPMSPITGHASGPIASLFVLAIFLPYLAVGWRRLHDTGRPGWYLLIPTLLMVALIAIVIVSFGGAELMGVDPQSAPLAMKFVGLLSMVLIAASLISNLVVFWWFTRPTQAGKNQYGPEPD